MSIQQILIIIGASIFGLLGCVHLIYRFFTNKFEARDKLVTQAMNSTSPVLTDQTTLWKAWIGFNASHSLGAMLVTAFYLPLAILHAPLIEESGWFSFLPILVGVFYLYLAYKYWFKIPLIGIAISSLCFIVSWALNYF